MRLAITTLVVAVVLLGALAVASVGARPAFASPWSQTSETCTVGAHNGDFAYYTAQNANSGADKCFRDGTGPVK